MSAIASGRAVQKCLAAVRDQLQYRRPTSPNRNRSENSGVSASGFDHLTDLFGRGKNHVRTVAHHSRRHQSRRATLRTILAGIGFQAEIAFPKMSCLAVSRGHTISVVAVGD